MSAARSHLSWYPLFLPPLLVTLLVAAFASSAGADTGPDPAVEVNENFEYTGGEQLLAIPGGVRRISVVAVGGRGAGTSNGGTPIAGGRAAKVSGVVDVEPESPLWILVGGNGGLGQEEVGGFNGGGSGGSNLNAGGGGGGSSDVRTVSSLLPGSLDSRLLVAAGGGGAGFTSNQSLKLAGAGGDAGMAGARAESAGAGNTVGSGGFGGGPGTASAGGNGGDGGFPYGWSGTNGSAGGTGSEGQGGAAGPGAPNTPAGNGGGGGGGLYGGGGGGGGTMVTGSPTAVATGGGGGGGGSSFVPAAGSVVLAPADSSPSVQVEYTTPGTTISGPSGIVRQSQVTFVISSEGTPDPSFECRLDSKDAEAWEPCGADFQTPVLAEGPHFFEARAENGMTNFDPTPARVAFTVDLKPAPSPPMPPVPPTALALQIDFGKPKLNRRAGTARLAVTFNIPGRATLAGAKVKSATRNAAAAGTLQIPVKARGKALRRLNETGRVKVLATIVFRTADGQVVEALRRVTLRKNL